MNDRFTRIEDFGFCTVDHPYVVVISSILSTITILVLSFGLLDCYIR